MHFQRRKLFFAVGRLELNFILQQVSKFPLTHYVNTVVQKAIMPVLNKSFCEERIFDISKVVLSNHWTKIAPGMAVPS